MGLSKLSPWFTAVKEDDGQFTQILLWTNFSVNLSANLSDGHFYECFFYNPLANSAGILAIQKLPWMFQVNLPRHEPRQMVDDCEPLG